MTIVILGGGISKDKTLPLQVKKRLDKAIEISKERGIDRFLVSGKCSFLLSKKERPSVTEAKLMKNYLVSKGIDESNIFLEEKSMDTISNAYYSKTIYFLPENENKGVVISSNYHIPRVKFIFKKTFGSDFNLEFVGVETHPSKRMKKRQLKLLEEMKDFTKEMKDGNHQFLKGKLFNHDYYNKKRPAWVKKKTGTGRE